MIGTGYSRLMTLHLQIVVITKQVLIPLDRFFGFGKLPCGNTLRHLATQTRRADNQTFVILLQLTAVGTRTHIVPARPRVRY